MAPNKLTPISLLSFTPVIHVMTVTAIAGMLIESKSHHGA
jgi:hypothetical protein